MNLSYVINYAILSITLTLFMLELGLAIISLLNYEKYKNKINSIINPIWEITGTFAVFYLVNFEATYPTLLPIVGNAYVVPLLLVAIFIILRNIFLIFSENIGANVTEHRFKLIYFASTLLAGILLIATLSSGISGIGINIASGTLNSSFLFNPFNILILISLLLFSLSLGDGMVKTAELSKFRIAFPIAAFAIAFIAFYIYLPTFAAALQSNILLIVISLILLIIAILLQEKKIKYSGLFNILFIILLINLFGLSIYPNILGTMNVATYMTSSILASAELLITTIGGTIVAISLLVFVYLNYIKKQ
jgi:cytochrome bd ubiquinol oxidase subunit II